MTRPFRLVAVPLLILALLDSSAIAQRVNGQTQTASHVSAEMVKGKLNPSDSKPGDQVAVQLKEDLKSNGAVVMKKGAMITGVIKNVQRAKNESQTKGQAQSMVEIEWLIPPVQGTASQQVMVAVQSLSYTNPIFANDRDSAADADLAISNRGAGAAAAAAQPVGIAGSVLGGVSGGVSSAVATTAASLSTTGRTQSSSNAAVLNMPSVIAADSQTSSSLQETFGISDQPLFKTGQGQVVSAAGTKQSVDLFSHLSNDTVLTSPSKNFEIASGAQMQLLVGVQK
jgi:hypothetical protein